jgi:FkbM family methyltransferase
MQLIKWFSSNFKKVSNHKNPISFLLNHSVKKVVRVISTLVPSFLDVVPIVYKKGKFNLRLAPTLLSYVMYEYPDVRKEDEEFIASLLPKGGVYLDVGANVGNTTLSAAVAVGENGKVYAYEAHPRTYRYLLGSIACNKSLSSRIITKNIALGESKGEVFFTDLQNDDINKVAKSGNNSGKVKVIMETLDEQHLPPKIDVVKIDVEGYELAVLLGSKKTLQKTEVLVFESYADNYKTFDFSLKDVHALLSGLGFSIYKRDDNVFSLISSDHISSECEDLIAVKNSNILTSKGFLIK